VVDSEKVYVAARSLTNVMNIARPSLDLTGSDWIAQWQAGTFAEGQHVLYNGRLFVAIVDVPYKIGTPSLNNKEKLGWAPKYNPADKALYETGDYIAYNNRRFRLFGPKATVDAPVVNVSTVVEAVPEWTSTDTYNKDNYVLYDGVMYYAANTITGA
jgi:hypothetical protein